MAQHRIHYENGCKTGKKNVGNGRRIGLRLVEFHATKFETRCQACERAALRDGFKIEAEDQLKNAAELPTDEEILAKAAHRAYTPRGAEVSHYDFSEQELIAFVRAIHA